jgi:hypothetical protein
MFSSLGVVALAIVPVYLTYRLWQHYRHTKSLEKILNERAGPHTDAMNEGRFRFDWAASFFCAPRALVVRP